MIAVCISFAVVVVLCIVLGVYNDYLRKLNAEYERGRYLFAEHLQMRFTLGWTRLHAVTGTLKKLLKELEWSHQQGRIKALDLDLYTQIVNDATKDLDKAVDQLEQLMNLKDTTEETMDASKEEK